MIGHLYRYPHPHDPTRFIYVGQGARRDAEHRAGRTSFGRRFSLRYPDVSLPFPVKEEIEISNQFELNEIETIWMFQYHTWKGYEDGMNLTFPGAKDYNDVGKLARTQEHQRKAFQALLFKNSKHQSEAGKKGGRKNVESGKFDVTRSLPQTKSAQRATGHRIGLENVKSGQIQALGKYCKENKLGIFSPDYDRRVVGVINGRKMAANGHCARISRLGTHAKSHVNKNKPSPKCEYCSEQNLIIAFA